MQTIIEKQAEQPADNNAQVEESPAVALFCLRLGYLPPSQRKVQVGVGEEDLGDY